MMSLKKEGFTLIELLTTIAIMAIVMGLGISYLSSGKYLVKKEAMALYMNLQKARSFAIRYRAAQRVAFNASSKSYTLTLTDNNGTNTLTVSLSDKVEFGDGGHGNTSYHTVAFGAGTTATFYPNGYCMPAGGIYLKSKTSDDDVYKIKVSIAGSVQIYRWDGSSWVK